LGLCPKPQSVSDQKEINPLLFDKKYSGVNAPQAQRGSAPFS
jgi:hypothetical protein